MSRLFGLFSEEIVRGIAPDEATFNKAKEIAEAKRFKSLGVSSDGSWLLATRFLQAAEGAVAEHGLPAGCRLIAGAIEVNADFMTRAGFRFSGSVQYERWQIPLLAANRQSNVTASFQIGYWPKVRTK